MHRNRIERTASKRWRGSVRRVVSAAIYNLSCFAHGCSTGWVSGALGASALGGGAWLAALPCLVALPAAPFFSVLADARGRKPGAAAICCSFIISWSLAAWCGTRGVWAARVAAGAGGAGALALAPVYCAEIAPRTRGLAAMPALACSCGVLFAYAAGGVLSPYALSLSMAVPPTVLLVSLLWLPETPSFLISIGRIQDAAKVMCWFDGSDFREDMTEVIEQQEVRIRTSEGYGNRRRELCRQDSDAFQPMLKRSSGLESNSDSRKAAPPSAFRELFRHRRTRRALVSCCILLAVSAGSGAGAVTSFAASVLQHTAHGSLNHSSSYNINLYYRAIPRSGLFETSESASLVCGTCLVLGAAVATISVDKLGRKMLLIWSSSGIACCLALLGAYCDPRLRTYTWTHMHPLWPFKSKLHYDFNQSINNVYSNVTNAVLSTESVWPNNGTIWTEEVGSKQNKTLSNYSTEADGDAESDNVKWDILGGTTPISAKANISINAAGLRNETGISKQKKKQRVTILWPPVILLSAVLFFYNVGLGSVPFVLMTELFTLNVRSLASNFLFSWMWLSCFLVLRYYGTVAISLGLHDTFYICSSVTLLGTVYTFLFVPETRGKSQKQIDDALEGPLLVGLRKKRKNREDP